MSDSPEKTITCNNEDIEKNCDTKIIKWAEQPVSRDQSLFKADFLTGPNMMGRGIFWFLFCKTTPSSSMTSCVGSNFFLRVIDTDLPKGMKKNMNIVFLWLNADVKQLA